MNDADVEQCASRFALAPANRSPRLRAGERLGQATGSSIEFHDYRDYQPGDDLRRVDWSAYARSDELLMRLHREEITPCIEIFVDTSASMASTPAKEARVRELVELALRLCRRDGLLPVVHIVGGDVRRHVRDLDRVVADIVFEGAAGLDALPSRFPTTTPQSLRFLVSDFLFPAEPKAVIGAVSRTAAGIHVVQVLDDAEFDPALTGGVRLVDSETGEERDLVVDDYALDAYRTRLSALVDGYRRVVEARDGRMATITSGPSLVDSAMSRLVADGILVVRETSR